MQNPTSRSRRAMSRRLVPTAAAGLLATVACVAGPALAASAGGRSRPMAHGATASVTSLAYADPDEADASFGPVRTGLASAGKALGIKVSIYDNKLDAQTALTNAQTIAELHPSVAIDWNAVASIGPALGRVFKTAGVHCIAVNTTIPGCPFFNLDDTSLGEAEGTAVAALAKKAGWTAANTTVLLVNYPAAGQYINTAIYGFYTTYAQMFPAMPQRGPNQFSATTTKVGNASALVVNGSANLQDTYTAVKAALQTIPSSRDLVVDTLNDDSGLGALRALQQAGRTSVSNTMLVGNSVDPVGLKELRTQPIWVADSSIFLNDWPSLLIAMSRAILAGAKPPAVTMCPQAAITKANVNLYYKGNTAVGAPPPPAVDAYLKPYLPAMNG
jgi:ribose transport system substrate-binding protein